MFAALPVETEEDRNNAFSRLSKLPQYINREVENLKAGLSEGYKAPASGVEAVIGQMGHNIIIIKIIFQR